MEFNVFILRTSLGRARAWLRMALMQKKLADFIGLIVKDEREILAEYYEPQALMRSEEATLTVGLLVSINVVDCNIWVKVRYVRLAVGDYCN